MVQDSNLNRKMDAGNHFKNGVSLKSQMSKENDRFSMKTNKLLILFILNVFFFSSCGKNEMNNDSVTPATNDNSVIHDYIVNDVLYAKGSKLKHVSYVESVKSKTSGMIITQYEYDEQGRISKTSQPMYKDGTPMFENGTIVGLFSYSDYVYNNEGLLEKIISYHSNLYAGFLNLTTYRYVYDKDGNKLKEVIEYPQINQTDSTLYFYDKSRLVREDNYSEGYNGTEFWHSKLITYIEYEYNNQNQLVKEIFYSTEDSKPSRTVVHNYQNGVNVRTEVFNNYFKDDKVREIRRYYDGNDNLIYLESQELAVYSSSMGYVVKYEYY